MSQRVPRRVLTLEPGLIRPHAAWFIVNQYDLVLVEADLDAKRAVVEHIDSDGHSVTIVLGRGEETILATSSLPMAPVSPGSVTVRGLHGYGWKVLAEVHRYALRACFYRTRGRPAAKRGSGYVSTS